jgi:hypothetical protein
MLSVLEESVFPLLKYHLEIWPWKNIPLTEISSECFLIAFVKFTNLKVVDVVVELVVEDPDAVEAAG